MAGKGVPSKTTSQPQPKSAGRRLWRVMRAVLYMLRRGMLTSGRKAAMDFSLLLRGGKIAGKPSEVEYTSSFSASAAHRRGWNGRQGGHEAASDYNAADIAKVFEMLMLNDGANLFGDDDALALALATPSPALSSHYGRSPWARQPRVIDSSPCAGEQQVDGKADEFIKRFYEQLRAQKSVPATPDCYGYAGGSYVERAPRPVAAAIA